MSRKPGLVVVLAGGPSNERQVSLWTAETIADSLTRQSIPYQQIDPRSQDWLSHLKKLGPAVVVIALHGTFGEDGTIQQVLADNGFAFTGSDARCSRLAFDKIAAKNAVRALGIPTPDYRVAGERDESLGLEPPVVIKPAREGSSYGITIAWNRHEIDPAIKVAHTYDASVLIEQYVAGTEVTCGVLDLFDGIQALPLVEIRPETEFFDFKAKYDARYCHEICPAEIDRDLAATIQRQSVQIFQHLGCAHYARLDWIVKDKTAYFLELNTLPGMTKTSLITKELAAAGITFDTFLAKLIAQATSQKHSRVIATAPEIRHNKKETS